MGEIELNVFYCEICISFLGTMLEIYGDYITILQIYTFPLVLCDEKDTADCENYMEVWVMKTLSSNVI